MQSPRTFSADLVRPAIDEAVLADVFLGLSCKHVFETKDDAKAWLYQLAGRGKTLTLSKSSQWTRRCLSRPWTGLGRTPCHFLGDGHPEGTMQNGPNPRALWPEHCLCRYSHCRFSFFFVVARWRQGRGAWRLCILCIQGTQESAEWRQPFPGCSGTGSPGPLGRPWVDEDSGLENIAAAPKTSGWQPSRPTPRLAYEGRIMGRVLAEEVPTERGFEELGSIPS